MTQLTIIEHQILICDRLLPPAAASRTPSRFDVGRDCARAPPPPRLRLSGKRKKKKTFCIEGINSRHLVAARNQDFDRALFFIFEHGASKPRFDDTVLRKMTPLYRREGILGEKSWI